MPPSKVTYQLPPDAPGSVVREDGIESGFIGTLQRLKYEYRPDITNRATLEANFREKFEALNRCKLTDADCQARQRPPATRSHPAGPERSEGQFASLLDEIVTPDVFTAAKTLRSINSFTRDDGTPLNYTLVNIKDWCKNTFEVINQLRINTDYSHHRFDVLILINGVPVTQIELKTLGVNPRRAMEQIVEYKNDPGNGYTKTPDGSLGLPSFVILNSSFDIPQRPYQVYAVQHMVTCIDEDNGNGFVWHTTGSGKTLTSFKAATLLKENDHIHKCVFVVDRKDLDRQTREDWSSSDKTSSEGEARRVSACSANQFNKFQEGFVEENTNTTVPVKRLRGNNQADLSESVRLSHASPC